MSVTETANAGSEHLTGLLPKRFQPAAKAVFTAVAGAIIAFIGVAGDGITTAEWGIIALGALFPGGTAYGATNRDPDGP